MGYYFLDIQLMFCCNVMFPVCNFKQFYLAGYSESWYKKRLDIRCNPIIFTYSYAYRNKISTLNAFHELPAIIPGREKHGFQMPNLAKPN